MRWALAAMALIGVLALVAVIGTAPAPPPSGAHDLPILRRGNGAEPESLDPVKSETIGAGNIEYDLFEGLVRIDAQNRVMPAAAESWSVSPDGLTYTITLRAGLRWSNGDPLTATDFVYSFRRTVDPAIPSPYAYLAYPIRNAREIVTGRIKDVTLLGVTAPDPRHLVITLVSPTAYFPALLAHARFLPVHRASVERWGAQFTKPGHLVSNGAFSLVEWTPQSRIVLKRNPYFHDADKVRLGGVIFEPIENGHEEINRFRAGEIDITAGVPATQLDWVRRVLPQDLVMRPIFSTIYLGFNMTRPPFALAPGLRRALSLVIDRDALTRQIGRGGADPAFGLVPPGVPGYAPAQVDWASWPMARRLAEAKRLYADSGYGPGHELATELRLSTSPETRQIAVAVAAMWRQALGVETSLVAEEFKVFLGTRHARKLTQVFFDGWVGDYLDPITFDELLVSDNGENDTGYANPEYDRLIAQSRTATDPAARFALLERAEALTLADDPIVPLDDGRQRYLVSPGVHGFAPNLLGFCLSRDMWMEGP